MGFVNYWGDMWTSASPCWNGKKESLAVGGFIACIIMGFISGIFAALPAAIIFTVIIALAKSKKAIE